MKLYFHPTTKGAYGRPLSLYWRNPLPVFRAMGERFLALKAETHAMPIGHDQTFRPLLQLLAAGQLCGFARLGNSA